MKGMNKSYQKNKAKRMQNAEIRRRAMAGENPSDLAKEFEKSEFEIRQIAGLIYD